ncbi:MAG: phosphatidyltransferase [Alphaproteobacteria bacterium HGW-Alphaproteobacteria-2]|nr:MAG: phosphatidyltransferase [Alphaproteobacteria bacterium HGW-Alphaproteobacteria-2]
MALMAASAPGRTPVFVAAHVRAGTDPAEVAALVAAGESEAGALRAAMLEPGSPDELAGSYNQELRKREAPYALCVPELGAAAVEEQLFHGSYKGVTDLVTKYLWPRPALAATRLCARLGLTPNSVTTLSLLLVALAFWLFWQGLWLPGLVAAWAMTFLDTVDGKLARVTLQSSPWGNLYDHGIDLIHPPFWYLAIWHGLDGQWTGQGAGDIALAVILAGYVLGRMIEGVFIQRFGFHIHVWQRVDSMAREVTARRNPNLLIFTLAALVGAPEAGFVAVALWTVLWGAFHLVRLVQALGAPRRPASWLEA